MSTDHNAHLIEIPSGGNDAFIWNRLHGEREDICEAMLSDCETISEAGVAANSSRTVTTSWHRALLQERLRKIDDALDRMMSGSYGHCSKCGRWIGDTELEFDPAIANCHACEELKENQNRLVCSSQDSNQVCDSTASVDSSSEAEVVLESLQPFDTILVRTLNSHYRILLLDPKTGRALVEGGHYLMEPREGLVTGSKLNGSLFKLGAIVVGYHLEMWVDEQLVSTSLVQSINVEERDSAESPEAIMAAGHWH